MVKPTGNAMPIAINDVKIVPEASAKIPKCFSLNKGVHFVLVKNSMIETLLKKEILSNKRTTIIPIVVNMVTEVNNCNSNSINFSFNFISLKCR